MEEKQPKKHIPHFNDYLIKRLKLKPNRYTQNDFLYKIHGSDYSVLWNPRCQMIDIHPPEERKEYSYREYNIMLEEIKKWWEKLCWDFFMEHKVIITQDIILRLYGVKSNHYDPDYKKIKYVSYLNGSERWDWQSVDDWPEIAKTFLRKPLFRFAFWGNALVETEKQRRSRFKGCDKILEKDKEKRYIGNPRLKKILN